MAWILCAVLALAVVVLAVRLIAVNRKIEGLASLLSESLSLGLSEEIKIDTSNKRIKALVASLNGELSRLRELQQSYFSGECELKEAVTNIAHDLRTPLTAIYGYIDLLSKEEQSDTVKRYVAAVENRVTAIARLTEELFGYAVITSSGNKAFEEIDVRRALEEALISSYPLFDQRGIEPCVSLPEHSVVRVLNSDSLSRIFGNIISNAAKYSENDFSVVMTAEGTITFSNRALGLTELEVSRLFDRFFTVDPSRRSTGLGLSIAKTLALQMGMTINAKYENDILSIVLEL